MDDLAEKYLATLTHERRLSALTVKHYRRDLVLLEALCAETKQPRALSALLDTDIRRYAAMLHSRGLAPRSIARVLSGWRGFYTFLTRDAGGVNPAAAIKAPKAAKRLPETLSPDEAVQLVSFEDDSPTGIRDRAIFELIYSCGLRVSELTNLDRPHIDLSAAEARVTGKGNKTRIVPIGRHAVRAIEAWLTLRDAITHRADDALFVGTTGRRITPRMVQSHIKIWAARQGMKGDPHPHMLRHSFASHVLQSSGDLRAVQEMLGHASIASTQVYTHLDFQHLAKVYDVAHPRAKKKVSPS